MYSCSCWIFHTECWAMSSETLPLQSDYQSFSPLSVNWRGGITWWHLHCWMEIQRLPSVCHTAVQGCRRVPLEAQESLEGFFAGGKTAPWGCTRRTTGCRAKRPQYRTSGREGWIKMGDYTEVYQQHFSTPNTHFGKNLHDVTEDLHSSVYSSIWSQEVCVVKSLKGDRRSLAEETKAANTTGALPVCCRG